MNKAYKFRIYPNNEQKQLIAKTFGCVRFIHNRMLDDKIEHYKMNKTKLNNTPAMYKTQFPWLKEVDSLALANTQLNLESAFKNFFRNNKFGYPKFKCKKDNHLSYTTNCVNGNIKLKNGYIILPKLKAVKTKQHRVIPQDYKLKAVTLSKTPSGKFFVSILFAYEKEIEEIVPRTFLGLDFSMKELYVASNQTSACYPRYYRQTLDKLARESKKLSKMKKESNNRRKQRIKVARIHEKIVNQRRDFLHKKSKYLVDTYDCICVEDLNMQAMMQALKLGKSVADNSFGTFVRLLEYKLSDQGKRLIKIDKWFASTKTCSHCGNVQEITLAKRVYHCNRCGITIDRDYNASINIMNEGKRLVLS